jgi:ABC-type bacteriocin/lantibiotic exporter with double-glycine peptidase domain
MQALLGETITHKGFLSVALNGSIAFCAQTPWLINQSIQQNILGTSVFDGPWYAEVLKACALLEDLRNYSAGDRTLVGSMGITLSGGQKQRIVCYSQSELRFSLTCSQALARAVYARKPIVILDGVFSGLDPITENIIFQSLFGTDGIFRRGSQTVILATHAVHLLSKADMVILLGNNGDITYQGEYSSFPTKLIAVTDLHDSTYLTLPDKAIMTERLEIIPVIGIFHPVAQHSTRCADEVRVSEYL